MLSVVNTWILQTAAAFPARRWCLQICKPSQDHSSLECSSMWSRWGRFTGSIQVTPKPTSDASVIMFNALCVYVCKYIFLHHLFLHNVPLIGTAITLIIPVVLYIGWQWHNFIMSYMPASVFPPLCGASSAKCLLFWHHFLSNIVIIWTFS